MIFGLLYPDALYAFQEKHSNFTLEILEQSDTQVMQYVLECPTRFGMIAEPEHWHGRKTNYNLIQTFRLQLCVHKDNPIAKRKSVNFGDLKDEKFLVLDKRSYYQSILKNKAAEYGFEPKIAFESADIHQLCSLINTNKGIMFCVPIEAHSLFKNLRFVPFEDKDMTFSIAFIFRNYEKLDMPSRRFIEFIKEHSLGKT